MNKLLISLLSLVSASAVGTGGYFLLRSNEENSEQKVTDGQGSGGGGESETSGGGTKVAENGQSPSINGKSGASSSTQTPDSQSETK